jgi:hypothetical protein
MNMAKVLITGGGDKKFFATKVAVKHYDYV